MIKGLVEPRRGLPPSQSPQVSGPSEQLWNEVPVSTGLRREGLKYEVDEENQMRTRTKCSHMIIADDVKGVALGKGNLGNGVSPRWSRVEGIIWTGIASGIDISIRDKENIISRVYSSRPGSDIKSLPHLRSKMSQFTWCFCSMGHTWWLTTNNLNIYVYPFRSGSHH